MNDRENPLTLRYRFEAKKTPELERLEKMLGKSPPPRVYDLSRRRADVVKQALVTGHGVDAARLATAGFGAARPKESNDTVAGRARNRRVELARK